MRYTHTLLFLVLCVQQSFAELLVYPTRIVLSDKQRVMNVTVRHTGKEDQAYKMSLTFIRISREGEVVRNVTPTAEERPALGMVRFTPRQTRLKPNVEQVVRVMATPRAGLADGEYRAHVNFEPVASEEEAPKRDVAAEKRKEVQAQLNLEVQLAVPIIYRKGSPTFQASLDGANLQKKSGGEAHVVLDLISKGNAFPYGDFVAFFKPQDANDEKEIGVLKGIAGYAPTQRVSIPIEKAAGPIAAGLIRVEFRSRGEAREADKVSVLAKTEFQVKG